MQSLVKCYVKKTVIINDPYIIVINGTSGSILVGEYAKIKEVISNFEKDEYYLEVDYHNAIFDYPNYVNQNIRIEKGAVIRENVTIEEGAIVLMNATINVGAHIGANTMIDMNAVVGSGAYIGANTHIGAGAVISGMLEPICISNVSVGDNVFIGANTVILEGVKVGDNAIIGAGSVITKDVEANTLVYGSPGKFIRIIDDKLRKRLDLNPTLRNNF